jgi:hypothetical protein
MQCQGRKNHKIRPLEKTLQVIETKVTYVIKRKVKELTSGYLIPKDSSAISTNGWFWW